MFCCCKGTETQDHYQVVSKNADQETVVKYVTHLNQIDAKLTANQEVMVRPVLMSDYKEIVVEANRSYRKFKDSSFPANSHSLGDIGVPNVTWKRITDFINYPTLFDHNIGPYDVVHRNVGDCYLLSAIAALAEDANLIRQIFYGQSYSQVGAYRVILSIDGVIQEVVVDDFIPLNEQGLPIFCRPKVRDLTGQFWTLILEKALAKAKGSYANLMGMMCVIIEGTPSEIFRTVTYCPAESLVFEDTEADSEKIWDLLTVYSGHCEPCCATTKDQIPKHSGLIAEHTYTVLAVACLTLNEGPLGNLSSTKKERVVKLRNPWAGDEDSWSGKSRSRSSGKDRQFWQHAEQDRQFTFIKQSSVSGDHGIFYITFDEFLKYMNQIHYCNVYGNTKISSQSVVSDHTNIKGHFWDLNVSKKGTYTFQLSQSRITEQTRQQKKEEGICRASLVLIEDKQGRVKQNDKIKERDKLKEGTGRFKEGVMKLNQDHINFSVELTPGKYKLYALIEPTRVSNLYPDSSIINVFSSSLVQMTPADSFKCSNVLREAFLNDGLHYQKRIKQNNGTMSLSHRMLFQQGGFGYIVFHNEKSSDKCFVINYDQNQFAKANLQILEPCRHDKNFEIRIQPGHDMIILVRVKNQQVNSWKFPPKMSVTTEQLFG